MSYRFLAFFLLFFSYVSMASNLTIYRWVDKDDIVHYSQQQPEHDNYTELTMSQVQKEREQAKQKKIATQKEQALNEALSVEQESTKDDYISQSKCKDARKNIKTLTEFDVINYQAEDGSLKRLSETEIKKQLELAQKKVEIYCQ